MSIILEAHYAKKLGLPGYSSHQYSVSIRKELSDLSQVETECGRLYRLLQESVDNEIQNVGYIPVSTTHHASVRRSNNRHRAADAAASQALPWNCSEKQKIFIQQFVGDANLDKKDVEAIAQNMFGAGVREMNRFQASSLIEELIRRYSRRGRTDRPADGTNGANGFTHACTSHPADKIRSVVIQNGGGRA